MTQSFIIHCKPSQEELLINSDLIWSYGNQDFDELDVIVDNNANLNQANYVDYPLNLCSES